MTRFCQRCEQELPCTGDPYWNHQCNPPPNAEEKKEIFEAVKKMFEEE